MPDELHDPEAHDVDRMLRSVVGDLADAAPPAPPVEDIFGPFSYTKGVPDMGSKRWIWGVAAAAVIAVIVAIVAGGDGSTPNEVAAEPTAQAGPSASAASEAEPSPASAPPEPPASLGVDADAGCGLADVAEMTATVDEAGENVTVEVTSGPACAGAALTITGTPVSTGIPIVRTVTLDEAGSASITDNLLGRRQAVQDWAVELTVDETGGIAAFTTFSVGAFCDLEATADLEATYSADTNEIDIVFSVDPLCAGTTMTFDRGEFFASSPRGGWAVYTVDDDGRIEVTEQVVVDRDVIAVEAIPVPESRGVAGGSVAMVVVDLTG